jgi:hypothetical protein
MKKNLKSIVNLSLSVALFATITGCNRDADQTMSASPSPSNTTQSSASPQASSSSTSQNSEIDAVEQAKRVTRFMPEIIKLVKATLIEQPSKLWSGFNTSGKQILLINESDRIAYLLNNQRPELGSKEEVIEYDTSTFAEKNIDQLILPFGEIQFNEKSTYYANISMLSRPAAGIPNDEQSTFERVMATVIHESIHLLLQKDTPDYNRTAGLRGQEYPFDVMSRYYRHETYAYLQDAILATNQDDKVKAIKQAVYFHEKFLKENPKNVTMDLFDSAEGQAEYITYKYQVLSQNPTYSAQQLQDETKNYIVKENNKRYPTKSGEYPLIPVTEREHYMIGALAIANLFDLGLNPSTDIYKKSGINLLKQKYGSSASEGHKGLKEEVMQHFTSIADGIKSRIDDFEKNVKSTDYAKVKIPVTVNNMSFGYDKPSILYNYNNQSGALMSVSQEMRLGKSEHRLKLSKLSVFTPMGMPVEVDQSTEGTTMEVPVGGQQSIEGNTMKAPVGGQQSTEGMMMQPPADMVMFMYLALIPKADIQVKDNLLTIQREDLNFFDIPFDLVNGEYVLRVK